MSNNLAAKDLKSIDIYTDGSCLRNPQGPGGFAAIRVEKNRLVNKISGGELSTTNNRMEMRAIIAAYQLLSTELKELKELKNSSPHLKITIWSDSELCVKTLNVWAAGWQKAGWRRREGPVKNLDLVKTAYELFTTYQRIIKISWIRGHGGHKWNEYVDRLAVAAAKNQFATKQGNPLHNPADNF